MEYTRLKYIESNGTQYIDTAFKPNQDTRVVMDIDCLIDTGITSKYIFGTDGGSSSKLAYSVSTYNNAYQTYYNTSGAKSFTNNGVSRMVIDKNKQNTYCNNALVASASYASFQCDYSAYLFCNNRSGSAYNQTSLKLYSCQIYDNGTLVRDYIPMANEQGVCGLYDNVNKVFYTSANGNNFFGVREDNGLPVGYTNLEYIESDGRQWIDTGFSPTSNSRVVLDFKLTGETSDRGLFGARGAAPSYANRFCFWCLKGVFRTDYGTNNQSFPSGIDIFERHTVDKNKSETTLDGNYSLANTTTTYSSDYSLYIFTCNEGGKSHLPTPMRLYSCQIYDDNVLVRDYIPAMSENGVCGLWDKENGVFYSSLNGNNFVGHIEGQELPIGYTKCEYIEGNGMQYIDTSLVVNKSDNKKMQLTALFTNDAYGGANGYMQFKSGICINKKATISVEYANNIEKIYVDSVLSSTDDWTSRYSGSNVRLGLFKLGEEGNKWHDQAPQIGKLYSCQIYDNGSLVRDYIPCQDMYGVYGLYDLVNNKFYQSASLYGFSGKWIEDKILLVSPSEFRKRLMMLAEVEQDQSTWRGVFIEDTTGKLWRIDEWNGRATFNSVAIISDTHSFGIAPEQYSPMYGFDNTAFGYDDLYVYTGRTFGRTPYIESNAYTEFDGEKNTDRIISLGGLGAHYAAPIARAYTFQNGMKGYLMAAGEYKMIKDNLYYINQAMEKVGGTVIKLNPNYEADFDAGAGLWTSTLIDYKEIYSGSVAMILNSCPFADAYVQINQWNEIYFETFYHYKNRVGAVPPSDSNIDRDNGSYKYTKVKAWVRPLCRLMKF